MTTPQARLDADVASLAAAIAAEVDALKAQPTAADLDFTHLEGLLEQVKASVPVAPKSAAELVPALQPVTPAGPVQIPVTAQTNPAPGANVNAAPAPSPVDTGAPATDAATAAPAPVNTPTSSVPSASVPTATAPVEAAPVAEVEKPGEAPDGDKDADDAVKAPATATTPAASTVSPESKPAGKPLYEYTGVNAPSLTDWAVAPVKTSDGKTLYTFDGDTAGGKPTGASADWQSYTGPTA